ncbi:MAG: Hsp20/alpha crystallin family protein [Candidatus Hodarchaeales archaeon]|jgi:HSP20 family protein
MDKNKRIRDSFWNMKFNDLFKAFNEDFEQFFKNNESEYSENGPITFGYSMRIGPETNYQPEVRQWGNLNDYRQKVGLPQFNELSNQNILTHNVSKQEKSNRFIDILDEDEYLKVIVEVPGFTKENMSIEVNEDGSALVLKGKAENREIDEQIELPSKIEPKETKSTIKNGVLEILSKKKKSIKTLHKLKID